MATPLTISISYNNFNDKINASKLIVLNARLNNLFCSYAVVYAGSDIGVNSFSQNEGYCHATA